MSLEDLAPTGEKTMGVLTVNSPTDTSYRFLSRSLYREDLVSAEIKDIYLRIVDETYTYGLGGTRPVGTLYGLSGSEPGRDE